MQHEVNGKISKNYVLQLYEARTWNHIMSSLIHNVFESLGVELKPTVNFGNFLIVSFTLMNVLV